MTPPAPRLDPARARLELLAEAQHALLAGDSSRAIAAAALRRLRPIVHARRAAVALCDFDRGDAEWLVVETDTAVRVGPGSRFPLAMLGDIEALRGGQVQRLVVQDLRDLAEGRALANEGIDHYVVVPLRAEGVLLGTLNFGSDERRPLDGESIAIAREVADQLAVALWHARAVEALRAGEERFRATFEQAAVGIAQIGLDGRYLLVNDRFCDITGYTRDALLVRSFRDITHPDDIPREAADRSRLMAGRAPNYSINKRYVRPDGETVWARVATSLARDSAGAPSYFILVVEDWTALRRAEAAEGAANDQVRRLQAVSDAALTHLKLDDLLRELLLRVRDLLGVDTATVLLVDERRAGLQVRASIGLEEEINAHVRVPMGRGFAGRIAAERRAIIVDDVRAIDVVSPWLRKLHALLGAPLIAGDDVLGVLHVGTLAPRAFTPEDVDFLERAAERAARVIERARHYEALARARDELEERVLERTQQLQEVNDELEAFAYSISHDLRAPLRALHGLTQALVEDYGERLDATGHEYARTIVDSAIQMERLVEDLLEYSRLSRAELPLTRVDLDEVLQYVLYELRADVAARSAGVTVPKPLGLVRGHRTTLEQVVTNLVANALKFVPAGRTPTVRIHAEHGGGTARLWIEDNGIGIAPEHQQRIFKVFERLHGNERYPGTGIGLALARRGVERMGGKVGVDSRVGEGSRFWIELPEVP